VCENSILTHHQFFLKFVSLCVILFLTYFCSWKTYQGFNVWFYGTVICAYISWLVHKHKE